MVIINLNDKQSKGIHWVSLCIDRNTAVHFDSFVIEYIPKDVLKNIKHKSITHNFFRTQDDDSIMSRFYFISFIKYMIAGKTLTRQFINTLKGNMAKENIGLYFRQKKKK